MDVLKYRSINDSFNKQLVFHLGAEAGFYSEFNNMVSAVLFCLKYEYKFILYSTDANFGHKQGWRDYFVPFCPETRFFIHKYLNTRINKPQLSKKQRAIRKIYRILNPNTYFTYELWNKFYSREFDNEFFDIPALGIRGDLREASAKIVEMIYRFNNSTLKDINKLVESIEIPQRYISMQIRRGDKKMEFDFLPVDEYFKTACTLTDCRDLFVLTDDYETLNNIKCNYSDWTIYSLTEKNEKGYVHDDFVKLNSLEKRKKIVKLMASLEIIRKSDLFIGTFTANTGLFAGISMPPEKVVSLQKKSWFPWCLDDVTNHLHQNK